MSNARLRLAFAGETMFEACVSMLAEPPTCWESLPVSPDLFHWSASRTRRCASSPGPLPLVRFADKALRAFPTPLHAHGPGSGP
jgi:hypothetical protein